MFRSDSTNYMSIRIYYYTQEQNVFSYTRKPDLERKFNFKL